MSALPPAGWYPNPNDHTQDRYWDGQTWQQARPRPPEPEPAAIAAARPATAWVGVAFCAAVIVGALGPWERALGGIVAVNGTDHGGDGVYVIVFAAAAAIGFLGHHLHRWAHAAIALLGAFCFAIAVIDYPALKGTTGAVSGTITAGWGLWVVMLAGVGIVVSALIAMRRA